MTKAWKDHRDIITRLYIGESRTLDEVREIMQKDHNFKASTRSYRQHFDQWDLGKYNCKKRTARRQQKNLVRMTRANASLSPPTASPDAAEALQLLPAAGPDYVYDHDHDPLSPESLGLSSPEQQQQQQPHLPHHPHHHPHHHHHQRYDEEEEEEDEKEGYATKAEMMTAGRGSGMRLVPGPGQSWATSLELPPPHWFQQQQQQQQRHYGGSRGMPPLPPAAWTPAALPSPPADFEFFPMATTSPTTPAAGMEMVASSPRPTTAQHQHQQQHQHQHQEYHVLQQERVGRMFSASAGEQPQPQPQPQQRYATTYHHPMQCRYRAAESDEYRGHHPHRHESAQ